MVKNGMLDFEAAVLASIPEDVPYIKHMTDDRMALLRRALQQGLTDEQYQSLVKQQYIDRGFFKPAEGAVRARLDPYAMLRHYEDAYKARHPEWESPWKKRQRSWGRFRTKASRTIEEQWGLS